MEELELVVRDLLKVDDMTVEKNGEVVEFHSSGLSGTLQKTDTLANMSTDSKIGFVANITYSNGIGYQRDMIPNGEPVKEKYTIQKDGKKVELSTWVEILPYELGERCQEDTVFANDNSLYRFGVDRSSSSYRLDMYEENSPYIYRQYCRKAKDSLFENVHIKFRNAKGEYYYNNNIELGVYNSTNNLFYSMNYLPNGEGKPFGSYGFLNVQEDHEMFLYNVPSNMRRFDMKPEYLIPQLSIDEVQSYFCVNYDGHKFIINKTRSQYIIYYFNYYSVEEIEEMLSHYSVVDAERFADEFTYKEYKVEEIPYSHKHKFDSVGLNAIVGMIPTLIKDNVMANITISELSKFIGCLEEKEKGVTIHGETHIIDFMNMTSEERLEKLSTVDFVDKITSKIETAEEEIEQLKNDGGRQFVKTPPSPEPPKPKK